MNRREAMTALTAALPAATRITKADVTPDDVIVIEVPTRISIEVAKQIKGIVERLWPNNKVLILSDGVTVKIDSGDRFISLHQRNRLL